MSKQPDALHWATYLEGIFVSEDVSAVDARKIAAELRRMYALLVEARDALTGAANYIDTLGGVSQGYRQLTAKIDALGEGEKQ